MAPKAASKPKMPKERMVRTTHTKIGTNSHHFLTVTCKCIYSMHSNWHKLLYAHYWP